MTSGISGERVPQGSQNPRVAKLQGGFHRRLETLLAPIHSLQGIDAGLKVRQRSDASVSAFLAASGRTPPSVPLPSPHPGPIRFLLNLLQVPGHLVGEEIALALHVRKGVGSLLHLPLNPFQVSGQLRRLGLGRGRLPFEVGLAAGEIPKPGLRSPQLLSDGLQGPTSILGSLRPSSPLLLEALQLLWPSRLSVMRSLSASSPKRSIRPPSSSLSCTIWDNRLPA